VPVIFVRTEIVLLWSKTSGQNAIDLVKLYDKTRCEYGFGNDERGTVSWLGVTKFLLRKASPPCSPLRKQGLNPKNWIPALAGMTNAVSATDTNYVGWKRVLAWPMR